MDWKLKTEIVNSIIKYSDCEKLISFDEHIGDEYEEADKIMSLKTSIELHF